MKDNKFLYGFISAIVLTILVGCSSLLDNNEGVFGKAQATNQKADTKIRVVENQQAQANEDKLAHIGAWSQGGVEHALNQITNDVPKEVVVAKEMNARVEALAGKPDFKEVELIKGIVDDLLSQVQTTRVEGEKALAQKDKEIAAIQAQDKQLDAQRENEIAAALLQSDANAKVADQYKATLNDMDKWGGLGAVWYGLHKFVVRMAWVLGIGGVLFFILRILASSNPIAGAIFNIFEQMGSWVVNTISLILPKALSIAGNVTTEVYNGTKSALTSIVDSVETVKLQQAASGKPATIQDLLDAAEATMTPADKAQIEKIKLQLGWVKPSTTPTVVPPTPPVQLVVTATQPTTASVNPPATTS